MSTISSYLTNGVTLGQAGYTSALTITAAGTVSSGTAVAAVYAPSAYANPVVANYGSLLSTGTVDGVRLLDGGSVGNSGTAALIQGYSAGIYIGGAAGTVANSGTIVGSGTAAELGFGDAAALFAGGSVDNTNTAGLIQGGFFAGVDIRGGAGTVINSGTILATGRYGVILEAGGGRVNNDGLIEGYLAGVVLYGGNVVNTGLIQGEHSGVVFRSGGGSGTLTNRSGTIVSTGPGYALVFSAGGSVLNLAGLIQGGRSVYINGGAGTVSNTGTLAGTAENGVVLKAGGVVTNTGGLIEGYNALYIGGATGTVTNSGTILGTKRFGVWLYVGGTVTNSGTIIGAKGTAISFVGAGGNRLILDPGSSLVGAAVASGTGNTFELAPGAAGTGTVSGLGTNYLGFSTVTVDTGAAWNFIESDTIGAGVTLTISGTLTDFGTLINAGALDVAPGGTFVVDPAALVNSGSISGTVTLAGGGYLDNMGTGAITAAGTAVYGNTSPNTVVNQGRIAGTGVSGVGIDLAAGGTVIDSGTITGGSGTAVSFGGAGGNLLVLQQGYKINGAVEGSGSVGATNTLELAGTAGHAATASYNGLDLTGFQDVLFGSGGNDTLAVSNVSGTLPVTISGFAAISDVIDLSAIGTNGSITGQSSAQVTIAGSLGSETLLLDASDATVFRTVSDTVTGTDVIACFARGTLILTEKGEVSVEDLAIGDRVVTLAGEAKPIRWIGHRAYDGRFIAGNRAVLPIRIAANALAEGVPARDLFLSPEHSLYIDDALVQAMHLVNGATIMQADRIDRVEYFHIELDDHDVLIADGTPAESYVDCDNRMMFANGADYARLYPQDERPRWQFCAPRLGEASVELAAIRAALLQRAEGLGHRLDRDPDLHLLVDGRAIWPASIADERYRFGIPAGSAQVSVASRSAVPTEVDGAARDIRRLGVAVERIVLRDEERAITLLHDDPMLCDGFHAPEEGHRWTNGLGRLPEMLLGLLAGSLTVDIHIAAATLVYRLPALDRDAA